MLVLGCKQGERIRLQIGDAIVWVKLLRRGGPGCNVKLGFEAPPNVRIMREEAIRRETQSKPAAG